MVIFNFAAPILPGQLDVRKAFNKEISAGGSSKTAMGEIQKKTGIARQQAVLQQTPMGDFAVVMIEGDDPEAFMAAMGQGTGEYETWFKAQVGVFHGMDLNGPPPPALEVFYTYP